MPPLRWPKEERPPRRQQPWCEARDNLRGGAPLPPGNSRMRSAASARSLGRSTIREPRAQPQPATLRTRGDTSALGLGEGVAPEPHSQPSPDDLRTRGDAWARGAGGAVAPGATPHRNLARSSGGGGGVGRGGSPLGRSESGRLLAWLPPPATSYAIPYVLTTTQARATSAPPPRSPLLPAAAMSWRLPLK